MRRFSQGKYWVTDFRTQEWMFCHKYVVLVAAGERREGLQKRLSGNEVAECLSAITRRSRHSKYWVANFRTQEWMFRYKYVVLVAVGERHEGLQKRLSRNEVAELSEAELICLIQLGTPWSRRVNSRVHELDGSPHGVWYCCLEGSRQKYVRPARKMLRER